MEISQGEPSRNRGTVIVVEDDAHIADLVALHLRQDGFSVIVANDATDALAHPRLFSIDFAIIDIGLPGELDGFGLCKKLRSGSNPSVPILMLTARDDEVDRILGLEFGADDYVTKPFSPRELVARVHAIMRRSGAGEVRNEKAVEEVGLVLIDRTRREIRAEGQIVALTTREFDLLSYLIEQKGIVLSRRQLLDGVWGSDWIGDERTVDVHIKQLRKKLGEALDIATVFGVGYRLDS